MSPAEVLGRWYSDVVLIIESTSGMYVCEERGLGAFADVKDHTWSVEIVSISERTSARVCTLLAPSMWLQLHLLCGCHGRHRRAGAGEPGSPVEPGPRQSCSWSRGPGHSAMMISVSSLVRARMVPSFHFSGFFRTTPRVSA